jgi:hypothetical protein
LARRDSVEDNRLPVGEPDNGVRAVGDDVGEHPRARSLDDDRVAVLRRKVGDDVAASAL